MSYALDLSPAAAASVAADRGAFVGSYASVGAIQHALARWQAPSIAMSKFEWSLAVRQLREFESLRDGWDGYDAVAMSKHTLANARTVLSRLKDLLPCPDITPEGNGTVSFEWRNNEGFAHLEIGDQKFAFRAQVHGGRPVFLDGSVNLLAWEQLGLLVAERLFPRAMSNHTSITMTELPA